MPVPVPETSWRARPALAAAIEIASVLVPIVGASAATWRIGMALPAMSMPVTLIALAPIAVLLGVAMDRVARRLAPLSVLLRMAMVFPDRTPSRFAVAREAGHPRELTRRLLSDDVDEASAAADVLSLVGSLSAHDRRTRGHSERVRAYTDLLTEQLGLETADRDRLRWSGLLHDIGKLDVPVAILNKPGKPDASEWETLQQHPDHGARLAAPLLPWLGEWGDAIAHHHERYDGTGYPRGLAGEEISVGGRIVSVVDSFETMTASRSYKKAMSHRAAREELARCAGSQFDPAVVRAFLQISLPRLLWAMGPVAALVQLPFLASLRFAGSRAVSASGGAATALATPAIAAGVVTAFVTPAVAGVPAASVQPHRVHTVNAAEVVHAKNQVVRSSAHPALAQPTARAPKPTKVVHRHHHVTPHHHASVAAAPAHRHVSHTERHAAQPRPAVTPAAQPAPAARPAHRATAPARPHHHRAAHPPKVEHHGHHRWWHRFHHHLGFPAPWPTRHEHHHGHQGHHHDGDHHHGGQHHDGGGSDD